MDRCAAAYAYHKQGYNCAQSVAGAFADLTGTAPEQLMAAMGGFGGGVGGSHEELCGAVSGGVLVLSLLHPHTDGEDRAGKVRLYAQAKEFRRRFQEVFGLTRCGDLLRARPGVTERNPASQRLGVTAHCDNMIVTAVEILEQMLQEEPAGRCIQRLRGPRWRKSTPMRIRPFGRSCARIWRRPMERDRGWSTAGAVWSRDGM